MNSISQTPGRLSLTRVAIFSISCLILFIVVAVICDGLTLWITVKPLKVFIREVLLRIPLTLYAFQLFAKKIIKVYNPSAIYGKLVWPDLLRWSLISVLIPLSVWASFYYFHLISPFRHTVTLSSSTKISILVRWLSVSLAAGLTEQVFFRGHLFMIMKSRYSTTMSVFITSLIFGLLHIFMLSAFDVMSMVIVVAGGIIAGTMFSLIYLYTRVIWLAAIVHFVWDVFFIGKIIAITPTQFEANQTIIAFKLLTHNIVFTGGNFGIESTLPSFIVYLIVTAIIFYLYQRKKRR